jgi:hypothetical protein
MELARGVHRVCGKNLYKNVGIPIKGTGVVGVSVSHELLLLTARQIRHHYL